MSLTQKPMVQLRHPDRFFIGGEWVAPSTEATITVTDSATEQCFFSVAEAQAVDVARAVESARRAFDMGLWPRMSHAERADYLRAIRPPASIPISFVPGRAWPLLFAAQRAGQWLKHSLEPSAAEGPRLPPRRGALESAWPLGAAAPRPSGSGSTERRWCRQASPRWPSRRVAPEASHRLSRYRPWPRGTVRPRFAKRRGRRCAGRAHANRRRGSRPCRRRAEKANGRASTRDYVASPRPRCPTSDGCKCLFK